MANIALQTRVSALTRPQLDIVGDDFLQKKTLPAAEAVTCGAPVRLVPSSTGAGKWTNANASDLTEGRVWGIATRTVIAGESVTAVRKGILDGFEISSLNYDAPLYLSDTDGRIADSYGTVDIVIGRVVPGTAVSTGTAYDRLLEVDIPDVSSTNLDTFSVPTELLAASVDKWVWVAPKACVLTSIAEVHSVVGGSSAAVRFRKVTDTSAPGAAASSTVKELAASIDLTATINTIIAPTLTATAADITLAAGDKVGADFSGTLTGLVGSATLNFKAI